MRFFQSGLARRIVTCLLLCVYIFGVPAPVFAQEVDDITTHRDWELQFPFFSANRASCSGSSSASASGSTPDSGPFNPDPQAVEMFEKELMPKIEPLIPLYQKAAQDAGLADWEILPALHNLEFGLRRDNPLGNTAFKTPFQMNGGSLSRYGINIGEPMFAPGHELTDDEFVRAATYAAKFWLLNDAKTFKIDASQPVSASDAAKMITAYKSGAGSAWFTGKADFNLHAYAWAGFDTTEAHKLPMKWGPGSTHGDEVAGTAINKPGAATVFMLLKGGNFSAGTCTVNGENIVGNGTLQPVTGSREELVKRILESDNLKLGNSGSASSQRSDIQNNLNEGLLKAIVAFLEQSGTKLPVNSLKSDHGAGGLHGAGQAIDIGYFGVGDPNNTEEGTKLYKFMYDNWQALGIQELIWKMPPEGYQCIGRNGPTDCYAYYKAPTMAQHYHHIHFGVKQ